MGSRASWNAQGLLAAARSVSGAWLLCLTLSLLARPAFAEAPAAAPRASSDAELIEERPTGLASGRFPAAPWQIGALGVLSLVGAGVAWHRLRRRSTRPKRP